MDTALYYPYIEVPKSAWFTQILLYWNAAVTIVPPDETGEVKLSRNMRDLRDSGLLDFVSPLPWKQNRELKRVFLSFLEEDRRVPPTESRRYTRLHRDKVNYEVVTALQDRGLAKYSEISGWWEVDDYTANTYMAMLAGAIAECRRLDGMPTSPVTDSLEQLAYMGSGLMSARDRAYQLRCTLIGELPVPSKRVPPTELAKFKSKNSEQLQYLRDHLDVRINQVAAIPDAELREESAEILDRDLRREIDGLKRTMERARWPKIVFLGVAGVVGTAATGAVAVATAGLPLLLGIAVGGGALLEASSIYAMVDLVRRDRVPDSRPLAYAARVMALG